jgi:hypothetical protein
LSGARETATVPENAAVRFGRAKPARERSKKFKYWLAGEAYVRYVTVGPPLPVNPPAGPTCHGRWAGWVVVAGGVFKKGGGRAGGTQLDSHPSFLPFDSTLPPHLLFRPRENTSSTPPPPSRRRDGEAGAGEEVPHQHGGPARVAGGGAAGARGRRHAAVQPPPAPGDVTGMPVLSPASSLTGM